MTLVIVTEPALPFLTRYSRTVPLSVRPLPLPTLLSPWLSAYIFLQSSSLLLLPHNEMHCGFNFKNHGDIRAVKVEAKHVGVVGFH